MDGRRNQTHAKILAEWEGQETGSAEWDGSNEGEFSSHTGVSRTGRELRLGGWLEVKNMQGAAEERKIHEDDDCRRMPRSKEQEIEGEGARDIVSGLYPHPLETYPIIVDRRCMATTTPRQLT